MTYRRRMTIYFVLLLVCFVGAVSEIAPMFFSCLFLAIAVSQFFFLCPRCGKHIDTKGADKGNFFYGVFETYEPHCPRCDRTRENVWPLQFVMKREPWDGIRKDER
ncbi:hypothetical protein AEAC466_03285 [Asticcacaulis sp. AC466]|uniref:hypothetical protein n=1 Tax=Asticcacaulis sp. AC466 TaxID=1282362 RepID=UPI0003C3BB09|nr:hypothetical protein [Asticcacaulis sp. AC466]ESQ86233.1 hypothetical protein AEAC466_03285 [Asticcacaulis sp. AC466]